MGEDRVWLSANNVSVSVSVGVSKGILSSRR